MDLKPMPFPQICREHPAKRSEPTGGADAPPAPASPFMGRRDPDFPPTPRHPHGPEIGPCSDRNCIYCRVTIMTTEQLERALDQHREEIEALKLSLSDALRGKIELTIELGTVRRELEESRVFTAQLREKLWRVQDTLDKVRAGLER